MLFDSHVHFEGTDTADAIDGVLQRAREAGVTNLLAVGGSPSMNAAALETARRAPATVAAAVGFDRTVAREADWAGLCESLLPCLDPAATPHVAAIGEIGLDFHYTPETAEAQKALFAAQLALARERRLPVIIHTREADEATLSALQEHARQWAGAPDRIGVVHCFTGTSEFARRLLDLGFYISFSGIITFKNAQTVRDAARSIPEDRLLIETDSPFLAPVPRRGERCEPAFVTYVAHAMAKVRGQPPETLAALTYRNACRLFGMPTDRQPNTSAQTT